MPPDRPGPNAVRVSVTKRQTRGVDPFSREAVEAAYDEVASDYVLAFGDDLAELPLDRAMLDAAAEACAADGRALDLGCGPGTVGSYLRQRGLSVVGADLSHAMLTIARGRSHVPAIQADMRALPFDAGTFTLVVAYYSIQHVPRVAAGEVFDEVGRVLGWGGVLLVATHLGEGDVYSGELLGHQFAPVGGALYAPDELTERVVAAGFTIEDVQQRGPLAHEHPSQRIYLRARRASNG